MDISYTFYNNIISKTPNSFKVNKEEFDIIKSINLRKIHDDIPTSGFISKNVNIFNNEGLNRIKGIFDSKAKEYLNEVVGIDHDLQLTHSWFTKNDKGQFHIQHDHKNVFLSLCYYPHVKSGDLYFHWPYNPISERFNFHYNIIKETPMNSCRLYIDIKENDLIIFPGWLQHGTTPNLSSSSRIMIGANYFLKGSIGDENNVSCLNL